MSTDEHHLRRALDLASQGRGQSSPNPCVGAVITDAVGNIAGEATYTYAGVKHAEVLALHAAGDRARGGTLYINLEPHAHQGRTPPCTDALIAAGIERVVVSMADPNPKVSGKGFAQLRAAGVQVEVGQFEGQARHLNEAFARYIRYNLPLVTLKAAMTLDGKIAPPPSTSNSTRSHNANEFSGTWITGELSRSHVHELRHQHDALLVGIGTILADNPILTDRSGRARRRPLLRVVLDSHLRLPLDSRLVQNAASQRTNDLVVFCSLADAQKKSQLEELGVRVEQFRATDPNGRPDLEAALRHLAEVEVISVMIEGGATINSAALTSNAVDKVFLYYAPRILGTPDSIPLTSGAGFRPMIEPARVLRPQMHSFGEDIAIEGYLRDPYAD
jgi:diaminohydroxyphosphoribosylaminopyrimidine deaminase / 5-amino-6-(5-phosphoribosylamino)uracil reductase